MDKKIRSIGYCDGISSIQPAFVSAGITNYEHISVEYDKKARMVTQKNFPNTIFMPDVRTVDVDSLGEIDFFSSGFSCKNVSSAGSKKGFTTTTGIPALTYDDYCNLKDMGFKFTETCYTFWESIGAWKKLGEKNPDMGYLFENVKMLQKDEDIISRAIGHGPVRANSKHFTGQNRDRIYYLKETLQIDEYDKKIVPLSTIIPDAETGGGYRRKDRKGKPHEYNNFTKRKDGIANCLTTFKAHEKNLGTRFYVSTDGYIKALMISHMEQLQGLPIGYTDVPGLTDDDRIRMLGNCWTVPVIAHLLKNLKKELVYTF
jgi:DNA (cytosine-5)-methyltransferase 3A